MGMDKMLPWNMLTSIEFVQQCILDQSAVDWSIRSFTLEIPMAGKKADRSAELLMEFTRLMHKVGPEDPIVDEFLERNKANKEFARRGPLARVLYRALKPRRK